MRDLGNKECKKGGIQETRNARKEGFRKGEIKETRNAGKELFR